MDTQGSSAGAEETKPRFQYAAKLLCTSNMPGSSVTTTSVLPGAYCTAVNIHNPNEDVARLREKIALGPDVITDFIEDELKPDAMTRLDCTRIADRFGFHHEFEGFLVIESTHSLDVIAAYTAGPTGGEVASVDVEQVRERMMRQG